jgi:HEPN domain-containing protein
VVAWLRRAENDLQAGLAIAAAALSSYETAGFHAQQAAEKAVKAILVRHGVEFGRTHDVGALLTLTDSVAPGAADRLAAAEPLTRHAVDTRYPGSGSPDAATVSREEAARDLDTASAVVTFAREHLRPFIDAGRP